MTPLGWLGIARLGLVQAGLGAVVVLTTSTLNRVMIIEMQLPAIVPGLLVALHYAVQLMRPRLGYGSDMGGRRTPWIVGGMASLALGATAAAGAVALMADHLLIGLALALLAFLAVGLGVGAAGTSLLALLAHRVESRLRAPAATIVWLMMLLGIAVTATLAGKLLQPFGPGRLVAVVAGASFVAFVVAALAVRGMEGQAARPAAAPERGPGFMAALQDVWRERQARGFAVFVFVSMLAYSAQELVIEPFAGAVFGLSPGQSTGLTGLHHAGVLAGMALVAAVGFANGSFSRGAMRAWTVGGCAGSAVAALALAGVGLVGHGVWLRPAVLALGGANGAFAVAAIGSMMGLASAGRASREGTRVGLWGAAQALAFGAGGLAGTGASDLMRLVFAPAPAYAAVFVAEAGVFAFAAWMALRVFQTPAPARASSAPLIVGGRDAAA